MITLDIKTKQNFLDSFSYADNAETKENVEYINDNYEDIIQSEIEMIETYVNDSNDVMNTLMVVRDNQGESEITNDDGKVIGHLSYWVEINI